MFWPCETRTSTCRSFATISSGLYRFLVIAVLLDVKDIPQVGPLQWGWIMVTGANSGIGQAAAIALGQAGADVVVNYVTGEAQAVVDAICRAGAEAYAHKADVSQEDQVEDMFRHMVERFGTVDILVNNAGLQRDAAFHEMTLAQWNTVIGINLTGQFLCARAAVREFLRRG